MFHVFLHGFFSQCKVIYSLSESSFHPLLLLLTCNHFHYLLYSVLSHSHVIFKRSNLSPCFRYFFHCMTFNIPVFHSIPLPHRTPTKMMNPFLPHGKDISYIFFVLSVPKLHNSSTSWVQTDSGLLSHVTLCCLLVLTVLL